MKTTFRSAKEALSMPVIILGVYGFFFDVTKQRRTSPLSKQLVLLSRVYLTGLVLFWDKQRVNIPHLHII